MGLMDNIKKAQEMAQQAQQNMPAGGGAQMPDAADMQYAQLAQKIATGGLPGVATINNIGETGKTDAGVNKQYAIAVSIELENGEKYDTTVMPEPDRRRDQLRPLRGRQALRVQGRPRRPQPGAALRLGRLAAALTYAQVVASALAAIGSVCR